MRARVRTGLAAVTAALVLAGCAVNSRGPLDGGGGPYDLGTPGEVVSTTPDVGFYPACGNEVLSFDGRQWYPFKPSNLDDFPASPASATGLAGGGGASGAVGMSVHRVAAPGPGDDMGTLVVYEHGLAYWESDSGKIKTWLTTRELTYNWVC